MALLIVLVLGGALWLKMSRVEQLTRPAEANSVHAYGLTPMARSPRSTALFLGDDFAAGNEGVYVYAYPYIVCDIFDLNCNVDAQTGTGFLSGDEGNSLGPLRLIARLPADRRIYDANLIIVDAGRNDIAAGPEALGQAMSQYLTEVRSLWPAAQIVVVAPSPFSADPYPNYGDFISIINPIAESFDATFIDPIAEGWYNDVDLSVYQTPDGIHPNQGGQQFIAQKLADSLVNHGLLEPPKPVNQ